MDRQIVEIKAKVGSLEQARQVLVEHRIPLSRVEHQIDTYFHCPVGRLKLREEDSGAQLAFYLRPDKQGLRHSRVKLYSVNDPDGLKNALTAALGVLVVVQKTREIYLKRNIAVHLDQVRDLGTFVEIEVAKENGVTKESTARRQCTQYMGLLGIRNEDTIEGSYSDIILNGSQS